MKKTLICAIVASVPLLCAAGVEHTISVAGAVAPEAVPLVGNGHLGFIPTPDGLGTQRAYSITVHEPGSDAGVSKIRPVMSPFALTPVGTAPLTPVESTLDMTRAAYTTTLRNADMTVITAVRALRGMPHMAMMTVTVEANTDGTVEFVNRSAINTDDSIACRTFKKKVDGRYEYLSRRELRYGGGREAVVSTTAIAPGEDCRLVGADTVEVTLRKGRAATFSVVASICSTGDYADPWQESERQVLFALREGVDRLVGRHEALWSDLWRSDITIEGNAELQKAVSTALYHLYSSIREGSRRSIAPVGQSGQGYNGHIFWDADTWMLPVMAVLQPELARSMVDFRVDGLDAARRRAHGMGYRGAMYPWEADMNGEESTPTFALTGPMEQHITACVANGAWQYYCVSGDKNWLRTAGYPLMKECADFWVSRAEPNADGSYSINNVVGADEYAIGVDDNAFTNGAAKMALVHTAKAAEIVGEAADPRWLQVADNMKFHYFADGVMREHATYDGARIKQSDVTLLGYPLGVITDPDELLRNIRYYDPLLDPDHGPAMSHGVMAVTLARTGRADEAGRTLARAYQPNVRGPFMVLAETAKNNRTYFLTGAGAMLQGVIFGFAGIDISPEGLVQVQSVLPPDVEAVVVTTPGATFTRRQPGSK